MIVYCQDKSVDPNFLSKETAGLLVQVSTSSLLKRPPPTISDTFHTLTHQLFIAFNCGYITTFRILHLSLEYTDIHREEEEEEGRARCDPLQLLAAGIQALS